MLRWNQLFKNGPSKIGPFLNTLSYMFLETSKLISTADQSAVFVMARILT